MSPQGPPLPWRQIRRGGTTDMKVVIAAIIWRPLHEGGRLEYLGISLNVTRGIVFPGRLPTRLPHHSAVSTTAQYLSLEEMVKLAILATLTHGGSLGGRWHGSRRHQTIASPIGGIP